MILVYAVLLALILGLGSWVFRQWAQQAGSARTRQVLWRSGVLITVIILVILLLRAGAILWALAFALLPVLQRLLPWLVMLVPSVIRWYQRRKPYYPDQGNTGHTPQQSTVTTQFLVMTLNHSDGSMSGQVIDGSYQGSKLEQLNLPELLELLADCQADAQSFAVLQAYLDREHPQWRQSAGSASAHSGTSYDSQGHHAMSVTEARAVLGVSAQASRDDIIRAHRRLMQKFHPDRGGNDFLAARINQAKAVLLSD